MLSTLYKDERSAELSVFPFLEKVYLERILRWWFGRVGGEEGRRGGRRGE